MHLEIARDDLLEALTPCAQVAVHKTLPICTYVRLDAYDQLRLSATDTRLSVQRQAACTVKTHGAICLPAKALLDRVRTMPVGAIVIDTDDSSARVKSGKLVHRIQAIMIDDFPKMPEPSGAEYVLSAEALRRLLARSKHALPFEDKPSCNGVNLVLNGSAVAYTTDGARATKIVEAYSGPSVRVFLPASSSSVGDFTRHLLAMAEDAETVSLRIDEARVFAQIRNGWLSCSLPSAEPAPTDVMLEKHIKPDRSFGVDRETFVAIVKSVAVATGTRRQIKVEAKDGEVNVFAESPENGEASGSLECETQGEASRFCVDVFYFLDMLNTAEGETVNVECGDELDPIVVREGAGMFVMMPQRL